jgi:hypothetical protein
MKERPILFSGGMVRAILDGSKTQTRRIAKEFNEMPNLDGILKRFPNQEGCPYGAPGDRLWVRETWAVQHEYDAFLTKRIGDLILLEITDVRVQRLLEISEEDARAEGAIGALNDSVGYNWCAREAFAALWESIHGPGSWEVNPWVWAITFRRLEP